MTRIFGFDLGPTSVGWAVIDHNARNGTGLILGLGSRIFPETRDPKGTPHNQTRRAKRLVRRQLRRRRARRRALNECLAEAGFLPPFSSKRGGPEDAWANLMQSDPVALRKRGQSEKLEAHELGRALYHLAQRRHFKGRELQDEADGVTAEQKAEEESRDSVLADLKVTGRTLAGC